MKKTIKIMSVILAMLLMLAIPVAADEAAEPVKYEATANYEDLVWSEDNPDTIPFGTWKAGTNTVISLIDELTESQITPAGTAAYRFYTDSTTNNANGAAINGPYKIAIALFERSFPLIAVQDKRIGYPVKKV